MSVDADGEGDGVIMAEFGCRWKRYREGRNDFEIDVPIRCRRFRD